VTALPPAASIWRTRSSAGCGLAGVVDDDGEAVAGQAFGGAPMPPEAPVTIATLLLGWSCSSLQADTASAVRQDAPLPG
jgi:hypothetical protein